MPAVSDLTVLAEEMKFLRQHGGLSHHEIADRLGMSWNTYCKALERHPELGTIPPKEN